MEGIEESKKKRALIKRAHHKHENLESSRSDHKPIRLRFEMKIGDVIKRLRALSYNTSFASDLGLIRAYGSEATFLHGIKPKHDKRHYMKKAISLIKEDFESDSVHLMQEVNDADEVTYVKGVHDERAFEFYTDGTSKFLGGFQGILRELANDEKLVIPAKQHVGDGSYYTTGTFGNHCYLAYSVEKIVNGKALYPTVLTIWNKDQLGEFEKFYGKDIGLNDKYAQENADNDNIHHGRPFSCVRTTKGVTIINMHGPNYVFGQGYKPDIKGKLEPTIIKYMNNAKAKFGNVWYNELTIVGGDLNDTEFELQSINFVEGRPLIIKCRPPFTCCYNYRGQKHKQFNMYGDLIYAENPLSRLEIVHPISSDYGSSDESTHGSQSSPSPTGEDMDEDDDDCNDDDDDDDAPRAKKAKTTKKTGDEGMDSSLGGSTSYHTLKKKKSKSIKKARTIRYKTNKKNKTNKSRKHNKRNKRNKSRKHN